MAYVKILNLKSKHGIQNASRYVKNKDKTDPNLRETEAAEPEGTFEPKTHMVNGVEVGSEDADIKTAIGNLVNYASNPEKTSESVLITGINCTAHHSVEEMNDLVSGWKARRHITGVSRDAFHIIQSFDPKDNEKLTPQEAHKIGQDFARELQHMDDKAVVDRSYMMLVCTHIDREHIHNHIILCSYDIDTGRKFHECKDVYRQMKAASDRLCREHGLHVIENPDLGRKNSRLEYDQAKEGLSWKDNLRKDIEAMASVSHDWDTFVSRMESAGYTVKQGKYVTYTDSEGHRARDKTLGREWTKDYIIDGWDRSAMQTQNPSRDSDRIKVYDKDRIKQFYRSQEELRRLACKHIDERDKYLQMQVGLAGLIKYLIQLILDGIFRELDARNPRYRSITPAGRKLTRLQETASLAQKENIANAADLNARLNATGSSLSHVRKEIKKNVATLNKMTVINDAIERLGAVQDVQSIYRMTEGPAKEDAIKQNEDRVSQYKAAMSILYKYNCASPAKIKDFRKRYQQVLDNISAYEAQQETLRQEYRTLKRIENGVEFCRSQGFLSGWEEGIPTVQPSNFMSMQDIIGEDDIEMLSDIGGVTAEEKESRSNLCRQNISVLDREIEYIEAVLKKNEHVLELAKDPNSNSSILRKQGCDTPEGLESFRAKTQAIEHLKSEYEIRISKLDQTLRVLEDKEPSRDRQEHEHTNSNEVR